MSVFYGALLTAAFAQAQEWQPITDEDLKVTSQQAGNADAIILYHEVTSSDTTKSRYTYRRIKILTEKGKQYADVEIPFSKEGHFGTQIGDLKARTISPDGKITPFTGQVFEKTVIKGHGIKLQEKTFTLPDVQVGSIIEWHYKEYWSDEYVLAPHWILQESLAQKHVKFSYTPLSLGGSHEVDMGRGTMADGVYHVTIGLPKDVALKNPRPETMQLEMTNIPAYEEEEFSPPSEMMKMRVYFYYGDSKMLKPQEFWKEQGKYWDKEVEKLIGHSSAVAKAAQEATSASDTSEQKVRKVYALVQKMNNLSYQDRNLMEVLADERKANATAEQVLQAKTGTHDQLARLFVALVRSLNVPAYVMRVATREDTFFQSNMPEWSQLNSEIAIVNLDGKEVFLDPGAPLCPFGLLEWKRTMVEGMRQKAGGSTELVETREPTYADAMKQRIAELKLEPDGRLTGRVVLLWMGQEALQHRIAGAQTDEAGHKKAAEDELKALLPGSAVVKLDSLSNWDDPEKPLRAGFTVELPGYAVTTGKRLLLPSELFERKQPFVHAERKTPLYFEYPYRVIEKVQITLPPEVQVESLPQSEPAQTDFAICKVQRKVNGNTLEILRDFALGGISFPVAEYPKLKSFFEKVHANDEEQIALRTTPAAAGK
jgi:hypothetical protein